MRQYFENYFLYFLKPTLMTMCFAFNLWYLLKSHYVSYFYFIIYLITFSLKPFLFLILFIGVLINYKINKISEGFVALVVIFGIFFGLPVKECADFLQWETPRRIFNLEERYLVDEYVTSHFVVNMLIENVPITLFVILNNLILDHKLLKHVIWDPVVMNLCFMFTNALMISAFYLHGNDNYI